MARASGFQAISTGQQVDYTTAPPLAQADTNQSSATTVPSQILSSDVPELSKWITISRSEFLLTPMGIVLATFSRITEGELVLDGIHATTSRDFLKKQHTYLTATDFRFPSVQRILPGCPTGVLGEPPCRSSTL